MKQLMWALGGLSTAAAAWMLYRTAQRRSLPVVQAAEQLQHAWANYHTEA